MSSRCTTLTMRVVSDAYFDVMHIVDDSMQIQDQSSLQLQPTLKATWSQCTMHRAVQKRSKHICTSLLGILVPCHNLPNVHHGSGSKTNSHECICTRVPIAGVSGYDLPITLCNTYAMGASRLRSSRSRSSVSMRTSSSSSVRFLRTCAIPHEHKRTPLPYLFRHGSMSWLDFHVMARCTELQHSIVCSPSPLPTECANISMSRSLSQGADGATFIVGTCRQALHCTIISRVQ